MTKADCICVLSSADSYSTVWLYLLQNSINQSNPCTVDISFSSFIFVYNTTSVCKCLVPWLSTKFSLQIDESFQVSVHHPCAIWERTSEWNPGEQVIFSCTLIQCPIYIPKVDKQNKMFRKMIMLLPKLSNNHIKILIFHTYQNTHLPLY